MTALGALGEGWGEDRLGSYEWVKGYDKIIKYYPKQGRYACVYTQACHGLITATCVFVHDG
jgi:hypothetical protein